MGTRRILVSASNEIRLALARDALTAAGGEALVVAPTRGGADDFLRTGCLPGCGFAGIERMTLRQLAAELAGEAFAARGLAPVGGLGTEALAARAIHACRKERPLDYFEPVADAPGFRRALASTLSELRLARMGVEALDPSGGPTRDLARLLAAYERELAERGLADHALILELALERGSEAGPHRLLGMPTLLLDVALESEAERRFAAVLAERSPYLLATLPASDAERVGALERILGVEAESLDSGAESNSLERLRHRLFSVQRSPEHRLDDTVEFFSASGEGLECVEIARRVRLMAEAGAAFDSVAILVRDPDSYLPLIEDALRRAAIPAYFTQGVTRPDPTGRAFLALLDCAAERLSAARFAEYLSLGQVPLPNGAPQERWTGSEDEVHAGFFAAAEEPPPADVVEPDAQLEDEGQPLLAGTLRVPAAWEKMLVEAAVIGGRDRWARRLRGLEAEYRLRGTESGWLLERLRHLEEFALPLVGRLDDLPPRALWGDWLDVLGALAQAALRQPDSVLAVLSELEPMAEVGPVGLDEVRNVLSDRLRFLRREPPLRRYGQVFVGTPAEAAARSFEVVFLPGLAEGIFPRKAAEDPLLLDRYREPLSARLARQDDRVRRERSLLGIAAGAARSRLVVSYPRIDLMQGRARVPSFYGLEVLHAAEGRLPDLREIERRGAAASGTRLGWPAPRDALQAIDDAEYDLAVLEPLLHRPGAQARGHGAYLAAANRWLYESLRTRYRRWSPKWSRADGLVLQAGDRTLEMLAAQRLNTRAYSPSELQHYAACPYRFLLYAIHRLRAREEAQPLEQMDPLTRGALFHKTQLDLFRALRAEGLIPVTVENVAAALDRADRAIDRVAAQYEEELAPAIPRVWQSDIEGLRTDLRAWILQLVEIHESWVPERFEYSFGLPLDADRDPESTPAEAVLFGNYRVRGAIDLIERSRANGALRVTDHKTGKAPARFPVVTGGGEILQPALYGFAVEELFEQPVQEGLLYYCTQRGNYAHASIPLNQRAHDAMEHLLRTIDGGVANGFLPAAPRQDACTWCDYRLVCGPYEELRVRRKPPQDLAGLDSLRSLP